MWIASLLFITWMGQGHVEAAGIICDRNVTITLDASDFSTLEIAPTDYIVISKNAVDSPDMITNDRCKVAATSPPAVFDMIGMYDCDPYIEVAGGFIDVTWQFRKVFIDDMTSVILRFNNTCFNVTCKYDVSYLLNTSDIDVTLTKLQFGDKIAEGLFSPVIGFYDDQFMTPQTSVVMPGFINVEIRLNQVNESVNNQFSVQITDCWLNLAEGSEIEPQISLIDGNCVSQNDPNEVNNIHILRNFQPNFARFRFLSFFMTHHPINQPQLQFVHCEIIICNNAMQPNCADDQCTRKRREITRSKRRHERTLDEDLDERRKLTFGPIHVKRDPSLSSCARDNGGCSDVCTQIGNDVICACTGNGEALMEDKKTCAMIEVESHLKKPPRAGSPAVMFAVSLLAFSALLASCLVIISCRTRHYDINDVNNKL